MRRFAVVGLILVLAGCAGEKINYHSLAGYIGSSCPTATEYVEKKQPEYGPNRQLLYLLDGGMVNLYCADFDRSAKYFADAETLAEELWTKSLSKEAAALIVNDYTIPYGGEDFERALINLFSAVSYATKGKFEDALVECRRLDANLSVYNQKYEKKNVYKEDAFGRYLSGLLYESRGNLDDAFIDYLKAYRVYKDYAAHYGTAIPSGLGEDLYRVAEATNRLGEARVEAPNLGGAKQIKYKDSRKLAKIVYLHFNGPAPVKDQDKITVPGPNGPITLAFPKFVIHKPSCRTSGLVVAGDGGPVEVSAELVEDINAIAVKNLADRKGRVIAKTIARAAVKQAAIEGATSKMKSAEEQRLARFLLNTANTAFAEQADTRSWRTLPGEVTMTRLYVPEGTYAISAKTCGGKTALGTVKVKAGETKFVLFKSLN